VGHRFALRFAGSFLIFAGSFLIFAGSFLDFAGSFLNFAGSFLDFAGSFLANAWGKKNRDKNNFLARPLFQIVAIRITSAWHNHICYHTFFVVTFISFHTKRLYMISICILFSFTVIIMDNPDFCKSPLVAHLSKRYNYAFSE
jgi:hypothetical protein